MKIIRKSLVLIVAFLSSTAALSLTAFAAGTVTASIPVVQEYSEKNKIPSNLNRTFDYQLKAEDSSYPMPSGSSDGKYTFSLTSSASSSLSISFSESGVYKYTLSQVIPSSRISRVTYDEKVYNVTISVKSSSGGLISDVYISESGSSYKTDSARFVNSYLGKKSSGSHSGSSSTESTTGSYSTASTTGTGDSAVDSGVLGDRLAPDGEVDSGVLGDRENPDTGDSSKPILWIALLLLSATGIVYSVRRLKSGIVVLNS